MCPIKRQEILAFIKSGVAAPGGFLHGETIQKNKKNTKPKQGLQAVPTGKSWTGICLGAGTLSPK